MPLDQREVEKLIVANYPGLRSLLAQKAGDPQVAADLLNDAICTTWEKWHAGKIEQAQQIAGYVFQVAMNLLRNHRRAAGERADLRAPAAALEALEAGSDSVSDLGTREMAKAVRKLLDDMDSPRDATTCNKGTDVIRIDFSEPDNDGGYRGARSSPDYGHAHAQIE